jgi:predicted transposase YbfD/YdcC
MDYIKKKFELIEDKRHQGYIDHNLSDVLIIIMCSILCGLDGLAELVVFAQNKTKFFKNKFGIEQIPSKPTFSRILNMVDGDEAAKIIIEIMKERAKFITHIDNILAVDGKAIRSTTEKGKPHSALQILTAYLTKSGVVLGQKDIHEKTNEIPVFQEMLNYLDINGKIITADAMHCQKETCKEIIEKGGNYILGLKENQKSLHDDVELFIQDKINTECIEQFITVEKNGGRVEKRICQKVNDISWLHGKEGWSGLQTVFAVRRITTAKNTNTDETCYYISSINETAEELLRITREHWKIESMHWLLDVVFSEDECELISENGHKTFNILRKLALLLHKQYIANQSKKCSVKANLLNCLLNEDKLCQVIENL